MPNRTTIQRNAQGTKSSDTLRLIVTDCVLFQYSPDAAQEQITSRKQRRGVSNVFDARSTFATFYRLCLCSA